jgi:hypothetical protein
MPSLSVPRRAAVLVLVAGAAAAGGALAAPSDPDAPREYDLSGQAVEGVRPTAVGLPRIGEHGTMGAGDLLPALVRYHDSGAYGRDLAAVAGAARSYLDARLDDGGVRPQRTCTVRYKRIRRAPGRPALYRRSRACVTPAPAASGRPAIVLDIDETALSNYAGLVATGFALGAAGDVVTAAAGAGTAIGPVLDLYRDARRRGVAVFFVTGRPSAIASVTADNLRRVGYDQGWERLDTKPSGVGTLDYKRAARARIEAAGYDIVANVGDQESDLAGGHADRAFKLPNPFYFIAE